MAIPDDHTFIKRRMRSLGLAKPFDRPEYEAEATARDARAAAEQAEAMAQSFLGSWPFNCPAP